MSSPSRDFCEVVPSVANAKPFFLYRDDFSIITELVVLWIRMYPLQSRFFFFFWCFPRVLPRPNIVTVRLFHNFFSVGFPPSHYLIMVSRAFLQRHCSALHQFETDKYKWQLSTKAKVGIINNQGFYPISQIFRRNSFLDDFAKPRSRPNSSHAMTASPSFQNVIYGQSVSQKGPDKTRRTIDQIGLIRASLQ